MPEKVNRQYVGSACAAASTILSGLALVAMRAATMHSDTLSLSVWRAAFGVLSLLPLLIFVHRWPSRRDGAILFVLGFFVSGISPWLLFEGVERTSAAMTGIVLSVSPLITLLFATAIRQEEFSIGRWVGAAVAGGGLLLSIAAKSAHPLGMSEQWLLGVAFVFAATCIGAIYNVTCRALLARVSPLAASTYSMVGGLAALVLVTPLQGTNPFSPDFSTHVWLLVAFCGIAGGAIKLQLWSMALRFTDAGRVAVFVTLIPIAAAVCGALLLDEEISTTLFAGFCLVVAGVAIVVKSPPSSPKFGAAGSRQLVGRQRAETE